MEPPVNMNDYNISYSSAEGIFGNRLESPIDISMVLLFVFKEIEKYLQIF